MNKKVYIIGAGGIGISAIARYYNHIGWSVYGSDACDSELIHKLKDEGVDIIIGEENSRLDKSFDLVVYTEAIPETQSEIVKARELNIKTLTYPQALAAIANEKKLIAIAGTHGKSTTTSLTSIILKNSEVGVNAVIGTILKEFGGSNAYFSESEYFTIEACEYKRSFLAYKPYIGIITNIEIDHLDYYKNLDDYVSAFQEFIENIRPGGYVILNGQDENCRKLLGLRDDITYIEAFQDYYILDGQKIKFPKIDMRVPGSHVLYDGQLGFIVGKILGVNNQSIIKSLEGYVGVWRRMEIIGKTMSNNILISDYGHHPTEIKLTLNAIKNKYNDKKILTIFQPHQYNRTIELLEGFKDSFIDTDKLIIPDIYESRDTKEDKERMSTKTLLGNISHTDKINGHGLDETKIMVDKYEKDNIGNSVIVLLGAGNVDNLRYKIKTV